MDQSEQERNLHSYLNSLPYQSRRLVFEHLTQFIRDNQNECFGVRQSEMAIGNGQSISFAEVVGFMAIGKNLVELRIMIPHNYPLAAPEFDLVFNSDSYEIANHGVLTAKQAISVRKNMFGEELIRLRFQSLLRLWMNVTQRHICVAYKEVQREVNSPPLLIPKNKEFIKMQSTQNIGLNRTRSTALVENMFFELEGEIIALQERHGQVLAARKESEYKEARIDFLKRNIPRLEKMMKSQETNINKELASLRSKREQMIMKDTVEPLLIMTPSDAAKIDAMARHQVMKEAERVLVKSLQKNMTEVRVPFEDHKGMLKDFYEQMFDAQLQYLKICD